MPRKRVVSRPRYGKSIGGGLEAVIKPVVGTGLVHKIFFPDWITRKYLMGGRLSWISRQAFSPVMVEFRDPQPPRKGRHGFQTLPPEQWEKITLILATHTIDVLKTARRLGIPTLSVFRQVCVQGKSGKFWVVEMNNLSKKGTMIVTGDILEELHGKNPVKNYNQLRNQMDSDAQKLGKAGFHHDIAHKRYGEWIIRINKKTGIGERFLADTTNFRTG